MPLDDNSSFFSGAPTGFIIFFCLIVVFIASVTVAGIVSALRSRRVLRDAGIDPSTVQAQIVARMLTGQSTGGRRPGLNSPLNNPRAAQAYVDLRNAESAAPAGPAAKSIESRLRDLSELQQRGLITAEEYGQQRQRILAES